MSAKRESLIERVTSLPEELLDEVEQSIDEIVRWHGLGPYRLSDHERAGVRRGLEAAEHRDFVPDGEMQAFYDRHRK